MRESQIKRLESRLQSSDHQCRALQDQLLTYIAISQHNGGEFAGPLITIQHEDFVSALLERPQNQQMMC